MSSETHPVNYTAPGENLPPNESLPTDDLKSILKIGLKFAADLIEVKKSTSGIYGFDNVHKDALVEVVLMRLNKFYGEAVSKGIENAECLPIFEQLRLKVCEGMRYGDESLSGSTLWALLDKSFDFLPPVAAGVDIGKIREAGARVIPNNPLVEFQNAHKHILD